jgi:hypothetical protein
MFKGRSIFRVLIKIDFYLEQEPLIKNGHGAANFIDEVN